MARIVKEEEYATRRNEILDTAQRLVYTKGYEQMSIQDILGELRISKGAFYHYFGSKQALLEALIEHIVDQVEPLLIRSVQDPHLSALAKLQCYFDTAARWKTEQKSFVIALLRVWYTDHNAIVRHKVFATTVKRVTPLLAEIICQGRREGVFTLAYPDQAVPMILYLLQGVGDAFAELLLSGEASPDEGSFENIIGCYTEAVERILGAPSGSITLVDQQTIKEWYAVPILKEG